MRTITKHGRLALMVVALVFLPACTIPDWVPLHSSEVKASGPPITEYRCYHQVEVQEGQNFYTVADANRPTADITKVSAGYWRDLVAGINGHEDPAGYDVNDIKPDNDGKRRLKVPKACLPPAERKLGEPAGPGDTPIPDFNPKPEPEPGKTTTTAQSR